MENLYREVEFPSGETERVRTDGTYVNKMLLRPVYMGLDADRGGGYGDLPDMGENEHVGNPEPKGLLESIKDALSIDKDEGDEVPTNRAANGGPI